MLAYPWLCIDPIVIFKSANSLGQPNTLVDFELIQTLTQDALEMHALSLATKKANAPQESMEVDIDLS